MRRTPPLTGAVTVGAAGGGGAAAAAAASAAAPSLGAEGEVPPLLPAAAVKPTPDGNSDSKPPQSVTVKAIIVASILSSVSLILTNKTLMHNYRFKAVFLLTASHFFFGGVALTVASKAVGLFPIKLMSLDQNVMVGAAGVASIGFMNFSLLTNSVGSYQLFKLAVIPAVLVLQYMLFRTAASRSILAALAVLLGGVSIATVSDVQLRLVGLLFGVAAVLSTAVFNIWQGSKQKEHGLTSTQLMHSLSFFEGGIALALGLYFDEWASDAPISQHEFQMEEIVLLLLSCVFATSVNMCSMGLIGRTSAVTYQVVGHVKTCLVLTGGYVLFPVPDNADTVKNLLGIAVALVGVFAYTYLKLQGQK